MTRPGRCAVLALVVAACGDNHQAAVDARPNVCMPELQLTGEYIDWDSTESVFVGVRQATLALQSDPARTTLTAPNGRFALCIPAGDALVTVEPMAESGYIGGTIVVNERVVESGAQLSYRSFKTARAAAFGFDATKAHVFVHVHGGSRGVASSALASIRQSFDGTTWRQGSTGTDIYLGNIDGASTSLRVSGGSALGTGTVPLVVGAFTYVTLVAQ